MFNISEGSCDRVQICQICCLGIWMIESSSDSGADCVCHPEQTWLPYHSQDRTLPRSCHFQVDNRNSVGQTWLQWSFKKVDQRFPPAARVPVVEMSRYWFNGLTTQDADLHLPHLFSLCPFTVTELMTSIDQRALLWAWRKEAKGRTEGRIIEKKQNDLVIVWMPPERIRQRAWLHGLLCAVTRHGGCPGWGSWRKKRREDRREHMT